MKTTHNFWNSPFGSCSKWRVPLPVAIAAGLAVILSAVQPVTAASYTWNVGSGNWSTTNSWTPNTIPGLNGPLPTDSVIFNNSEAVTSPTTVNNTVDLGFDGLITNLTYSATNNSQAEYNVTQIPAGQTLTVSGNLVAGGVNGVSLGIVSEAYVVGAGTLSVTASNLMVQNYDNTTRSGATAYFNLSGLTNFIYTNSGGTFRIEDRLPTDSTDTGLGGNMSLASVSNKIIAGTINLGTSSSAQAGAAGSLALGPGTNIIYASNINISSQKSTFTVSNTLGGGLRIRGVTGADSDSSVNITIGNKNAGNGGTGTIVGNVLLNGCAVDIKAGTLIVGENVNSQPGATADGGTGVFQFDTGTVSANSVIMADNSSPDNGAVLANCSGTIDVGANGTLYIGAGQLFDLASEASTGPSTGTLIISNGLVNCQGPIAMGPHVGNACSGSIVFLNGGTLNMGPNSYVGVLSNAVTSLTLATNCVLSISIPSVSYTNICVGTLNWPSPDTGMTISVAAMPAGINPGAVFPFLNFATAMNGTFNNPLLNLPPGVQGNLSLAPGDDTIYLTITGGVGPGTGGVNQLLNPSFESLPFGTGWTTVGAASVVTTNVSTTYPNTSGCDPDTRPVQVLTGTNTAKLTGSFVAGGSTNSWSQSLPMTAGSTLTAGAFTYIAHEDMLSGKDSFYYEVDFKNASGVLLASYESTIVTNMTCGGPNVIPLDTWALMAVTNQMQVAGGINTGLVVSNVASILTAPPQTATAEFSAIFIQRNPTDSGSAYFDGVNLGLLAGPVPPTISTASPNLITLCTNTILTCTATSTVTTISSVQVIAQTTTLGGTVTNITTNIVGSAGMTVAGLGTSSASISFALATNTIYQSVIVSATDADGITATAPAVSFDTLTPTLVIEASDFNYSSGGNSGLFFDTSTDGGLALYAGQVGMQGIDENKVGRLGEAQSYYRPGDAVIMEAAAPYSGVPPTGTEQKFVTAATNGDTTDIEVEVGYNDPGDWLNYTRTYGPGGSAPAGTYNVWCYMATTGSGVEASLSELTSNPTQPNQTTNFLGNFGSAAFSDGSYNSFVYVPLVNQFGQRVALTLTNGQQTLKSTIVGNPNLGFYMLVPVAPIYTPVFENVSPGGANQPANEFTFTISPAQGASISTNGIGVVLNGVLINSGLSFIAGPGGSWTIDYPIASNLSYTVTINVTNTDGLTASYAGSFDTYNLNNFHWMAVDYDYSTNNGTGTGGSVGNGWTGGLYINNPVPTGDTNAPSAQLTQLVTNSYFGYPTGLYPGIDPAGQGAIAQQNVDIFWPTNATQDGVGGYVTNSVYRAGTFLTDINGNTGSSDGVGSQVAGDSFLLPDFIAERTNLPDAVICEFNIGYFYATNWLNYTRNYPAGTYNIWGRLAAGSAFNGAMLSQVTSGVGTSNQVTSLLGTFSDPSPAGYQTYHWISLADTNGNPVVVTLGGVATLRLTAPTNASPSGGALNPLFFMLAPATVPSMFDISASMVDGQLQISFPTQLGHSYSIIYASSLPAASWTQVGSNIPGTGEVYSAPISLTGSQGFYQVVAH